MSNTLPILEDDSVKLNKTICPICQIPFSDHEITRADGQVDDIIVFGYAITSEKNDNVSGWCFLSDHNEYYHDEESK